METVDLIASGYEWTCPNCDDLNKEIGIAETVTCNNCNAAFEVAQTDHAYGTRRQPAERPAPAGH